jgi:hypothetical protein
MRLLQHEIPINILAVHYRGYGHSSGTPSERGLQYDAQTIYNCALELQNSFPGPIIAFGQSLFFQTD